jgi:hypothetical protein
MGDGCMMEGISNEACSLAGHWGLGKLIALYDDNNISIDGHTEISFTEDVAKRFEALGWHVQHVKDGNTDFDALRKVKGGFRVLGYRAVHQRREGGARGVGGGGDMLQSAARCACYTVVARCGMSCVRGLRQG